MLGKTHIMTVEDNIPENIISRIDTDMDIMATRIVQNKIFPIIFQEKFPKISVEITNFLEKKGADILDRRLQRLGHLLSHDEVSSYMRYYIDYIIIAS